MLKHLIILMILLSITSTVFAQRFNQAPSYLRSNKWEATVLMSFQNEFSLQGEGGSSLDIDSTSGFGVNVGFNFSTYLTVGYKFMTSSPNYTAIFVPEDPGDPNGTLNYKMSRTTHMVYGQWNILDRGLTPIVHLGAGWTKLDSNVPSAPPSTGCWWDPWWGYICASTWDTYKTSEFVWSAGIGARWDIGKNWFSRGILMREFIKTDNAKLEFDTLSLEFGAKF